MTVRVVHAQANQCVRSKVAGKGKAVRLLRALVDKVVREIVRLDSVRAQFQLELDRVRVCRVARRCCRHFRTNFPQRQNRASRFIHASRRSGSGQL